MKFSFVLLFTLLSREINLFPLMVQSYNLTPSADNTIYSESDSGNGTGIYLFTGRTNQGGERRALLKFDLSSFQPADSVVSAELLLYQSKTIAGAESVSLFRLTGSWGEGTSDAVFREGMGATPTAGDATWNFAFYANVPWDKPGGDYTAAPSATTSVGQSGVYYSWTGQKLASDVRERITSPAENFGWIVIAAGEGVSAKRFNSRENSINQPNLVLQLLTTSLDKNVISENFSIYPNPSTGTVQISGLLSSKRYELIISDISGREVFHKTLIVAGNEPVTFVLPERGIYFIRINFVCVGKVVVI